MKAQVQKGFTLIELMIVVAIIGILAAVAIPLYSDYTQRAKAATGIAALGSFKTAVALCYHETGKLGGCTSNGTLADPNDTDSGISTKIPEAIDADDKVTGVTSASAEDGVIDATLTAVDATSDNSPITVTLTPKPDSGSNMTWEITCSDFGPDSRVDGCVGSNS